MTRDRNTSWYKDFLSELEKEPNVSRACAVARVPRRTVYNARSSDPDFREAWDEAIDDGIDALEAEARKRALSGSDTLLIFLLKSYRREVFGDRAKIELNVTDLREHAIQRAKELGLPDEEAAEIVAEVERRAKAGKL